MTSHIKMIFRITKEKELQNLGQLSKIKHTLSWHTAFASTDTDTAVWRATSDL